MLPSWSRKRGRACRQFGDPGLIRGALLTASMEADRIATIGEKYETGTRILSLVSTETLGKTMEQKCWPSDLANPVTGDKSTTPELPIISSLCPRCGGDGHGCELPQEKCRHPLRDAIRLHEEDSRRLFRFALIAALLAMALFGYAMMDSNSIGP